jgi:hypothetical protein
VIATTAANIPACDARIVLTVDGHRHERPVHLVNGMTPTSREAMILSRDGVSPF